MSLQSQYDETMQTLYDLSSNHKITIHVEGDCLESWGTLDVDNLHYEEMDKSDPVDILIQLTKQAAIPFYNTVPHCEHKGE